MRDHRKTRAFEPVNELAGRSCSLKGSHDTRTFDI